MFSVPNGATITRVRAWTKAASGDTCSFELYECAELTCDDGDGVAIMGAAMVADDTGEIKTAAFDNAGLAQYAWVCVDITATTGAPDFIWIAVTYVIDED